MLLQGYVLKVINKLGLAIVEINVCGDTTAKRISPLST